MAQHISLFLALGLEAAALTAAGARYAPAVPSRINLYPTWLPPHGKVPGVPTVSLFGLQRRRAPRVMRAKVRRDARTTWPTTLTGWTRPTSGLRQGGGLRPHPRVRPSRPPPPHPPLDPPTSCADDALSSLGLLGSSLYPLPPTPSLNRARVWPSLWVRSLRLA